MKKLLNIIATRVIIALTFLSSIHASALVANPSTHGPVKSSNEISALAPVTPKEADFEDITFNEATLLTLAPTTPKEATFDDENSTQEFDATFMRTVAPVTPKEAVFEDIDGSSEPVALKPTTPIEATFADL